MSNIPDNNRPNELPADPLAVELNITDPAAALLSERIIHAVRAAAAHRDCHRGSIGVAVVDDAAIQMLNRRHLQHDYPTDVISFSYELQPPWVDGELVVSWQTAQREAVAAGWQAADELILYVVHGTLHITGMDDARDDQRQAMRQAERIVLSQLAGAAAPAVPSGGGASTPLAGGRPR